MKISRYYTHSPHTHTSTSRAQGEVSIREALRELEMWGASCTFSLTPYSDSASKEMNIIRDWKELVNQVRENKFTSSHSQRCCK